MAGGRSDIHDVDPTRSISIAAVTAPAGPAAALIEEGVLGEIQNAEHRHHGVGLRSDFHDGDRASKKAAL